MNPIRQTQEDKLATETLKTIEEILSVETIGFTGVLKVAQKTHILMTSIKDQGPRIERKLEEIKSAALITNKFLKEIRDKEDSDCPLFETNKLLAELIELLKTNK